ncbi:type VI secretion system tube protein Hcp [Roseomonas sp. CECT 9278]|uniref:type VI secretion system tube protein Hcp n=1 Tax=Roseomonas sp. CECT 9278 TaxID=2845823 RepID=UPI001E4B2596|nr:type VI secretion system tube protein Hcp [Roseomonas sp. CECT 9278]CAH0300611.1 hypothetical protein ROS9278_04538 [Roseomonas sp. CECT 9278]
MPILLVIAGVTGNCAIAGYEDWLALNDFSWGGTRGTLQQRTAENRSISTLAVAPQLRAIKLSRESDDLTPDLWTLMLSMSKKWMEVIWLRTGTDGPTPYLKLTLENALITSMGEAAEGGSPVETITITYEKLTLTVINVGNDFGGAQDVVTYDLPGARRA